MLTIIWVSICFVIHLIFLILKGRFGCKIKETSTIHYCRTLVLSSITAAHWMDLHLCHPASHLLQHWTLPLRRFRVLDPPKDQVHYFLTTKCLIFQAFLGIMFFTSINYFSFIRCYNIIMPVSIFLFKYASYYYVNIFHHY